MVSSHRACFEQCSNTLKSGQKDADIALTYAMLVLTFPAGFIVGPIVGSALSWNSSSSVFVYWGAFVAVGYAQWFILVPLFVGRIREAREQA